MTPGASIARSTRRGLRRPRSASDQQTFKVAHGAALALLSERMKRDSDYDLESALAEYDYDSDVDPPQTSPSAADNHMSFEPSASFSMSAWVKSRPYSIWHQVRTGRPFVAAHKDFGVVISGEDISELSAGWSEKRPSTLKQLQPTCLSLFVTNWVIE